MAEADYTNLIVEVAVAIIVIVTLGSVLDLFLNIAIADKQGTTYEMLLVALSIIVSIPTAIIAIVFMLVRNSA